MSKSAYLPYQPRRISKPLVAAVAKRDNVTEKEADVKVRSLLSCDVLSLGDSSPNQIDLVETVNGLVNRVKERLANSKDEVAKGKLSLTLDKWAKSVIENTCFPTAIQAAIHRESLMADGTLPAVEVSDTSTDDGEAVESDL